MVLLNATIIIVHSRKNACINFRCMTVCVHCVHVHCGSVCVCTLCLHSVCVCVYTVQGFMQDFPLEEEKYRYIKEV